MQMCDCNSIGNCDACDPTMAYPTPPEGYDIEAAKKMFKEYVATLSSSAARGADYALSMIEAGVEFVMTGDDCVKLMKEICEGVSGVPSCECDFYPMPPGGTCTKCGGTCCAYCNDTFKGDIGLHVLNCPDAPSVHKNVCKKGVGSIEDPWADLPDEVLSDMLDKIEAKMAADASATAAFAALTVQ